MASFLDQRYQFAPYVETTPVDAMVKVGMYKQQQYDEGVQKINDWLDQTAALPVSRQVDKQYLQSSLNNLTSELKNVAGADFSNQQLIQSVGGATKRLVNDKIIRAGVASTYQLQSEREIMEADRKAGKLNPANETDFNLKVSDYLSSTKLADDSGNPIQFKDNYRPAYDWSDDLQKAIAAAHLDKSEWEEAGITTDQKGNPVVNPDVIVRKMQEGLMPNKVRSIVNTVFSKPQVAEQLKIEGMYHYRGYTPQMLIANQEASYKLLEDRAKQEKEALSIESQVSTKNAGKNTQAIAAIDEELKQYRIKADDFIKIINSDFDQAKVMSYITDQEARLINDYSWKSTSSKTDKNPAAEMALLTSRLNFDIQKERFDEWAKRKELGIAEEKLDIDRYQARIAELKATGKLTEEGTPTVTYSQDSIDTALAASLGRGTFDNRTNQLENQRMQLQAELLSSLGFGDLYFKDNGVYRLNLAKYSSSPELRNRYNLAIQALNKAHMDGSISPELKDTESEFYNLTSAVMERKLKQQEIESKYGPVSKKLESAVESFDQRIGFKTNNGKILNLTKKDLLDIYLAKHGHYFTTGESDAARKTIKTKLGLSDSELDELGGGPNDVSKKFVTIDNVAKQKEPIYGTTFAYDMFISAYNNITATLRNNPTLKDVLAKKEEDYRRLQEQTPYTFGQINVAKPERLRDINQKFQVAYNTATLGQEKTGDFKEALNWLVADKEDNLRKNVYTFFRGEDDRWYIRMQRNDEGTIEYSEPVEVPYSTIASLGGDINEKKEEFHQTFGKFLEINSYEGTVDPKQLSTLHANSTALLRKKVGKYSVGVHLQKLKNGYIPYAYINDGNGKPLSSGLKMSMAALAKDPSLPEATRQYLASQPLILSDENALDKLRGWLSSERYFDLLLKQ